MPRALLVPVREDLIEGIEPPLTNPIWVVFIKPAVDEYGLDQAFAMQAIDFVMVRFDELVIQATVVLWIPSDLIPISIGCVHAEAVEAREALEIKPS